MAVGEYGHVNLLLGHILIIIDILLWPPCLSLISILKGVGVFIRKEGHWEGYIRKKMLPLGMECLYVETLITEIKTCQTRHMSHMHQGIESARISRNVLQMGWLPVPFLVGILGHVQHAPNRAKPV